MGSRDRGAGAVFLLFMFGVAFAAGPTFGATLEELVGAGQAAILRTAEEPVTEVQLKNPSPRLLPNYEALQRLVAETQNSLEPNLFVETLSLYRKPSGALSEAEMTALFNRLTAISTLAGIEYYSESRKSMRTFYETSLVISDPASKKPLPDPVFAATPDSLVLYARQKDLTFGDNIYRYDYQAEKDALFFVQENYTAMSIGIIPAVGKNKFRTVLAVIDAGDSLLIYAAAMAKAVSLPGLGDHIGASFTNRAQAVLKWFAGQADGVFNN